MDFILKNCMRHPQYAFEESLVTYAAKFPIPVDEDSLGLSCCGKSVPFQLSERTYTQGLLSAANVSFITDLPENTQKRFSLEQATCARSAPVAAWNDGTLELKNTYLSISITPENSPLFTICHGSTSGMATVDAPCGKHVELLENGPIFAKVRITVTFQDGGSYEQLLQVNACDPYVLLSETMQLRQAQAMTVHWNGLEPEYRIHKRNNSGVDYRRQICPWLAADVYTDDDGLIRHLRLAPYDCTSGAAGTHYMSFLGQEAAASVFCTNAMGWNDGTYTIEGYDYSNLPQFYCKRKDDTADCRFLYPLHTGTRHTALALYPRSFESMQASFSYTESLYYRTSRVSLDRFKDWILEIPAESSSFPRFFDPHKIDPHLRYGFAGVQGLPTVAQFMESVQKDTLYSKPMLAGGCFTRIYEYWIPAFDLLANRMDSEQFRQMVAILLFGTYCCETEDVFPIENMLGGHPNFLLDVKNCVGMCAALFPEHPHALRWKDHYEKAVSRLLKYHIRPEVKAWGALGGRYTESYGTYLWASMKHATEAALMLTLQYGDNPFLYPQLEALGNWLVNIMTPPIDGRRTIPYSGAHAGCHERNPFYPLWNVRALGLALRNYAPQLSGQLLAICPPEQRYVGHEGYCNGVDEDIWAQLLDKFPDSREPGAEAPLKSTKFTGYGFNLRSCVGQPEEMHVFLQQLDEGPNYRWGRAAAGGCGNLQYYAAGKRYSGVRKEDFGDDNFRDDEVGCNFCVLLDHTYRSVGQNDLTQPLVDLGFVQYARVDAGSYSNAEYRYRSVLMVDNRYLLIYDAVRDEHTEGRFLWNNYVDEPMPFIHQLVPGVQPRQIPGPPMTVDGVPRYKAVRQDKDTRGVVYDGYGDFLTVVTHLENIHAKAAPFGAIIQEDAHTEYVFLANAYGKYHTEHVDFAGRIGFAREMSNRVELALLDGSSISAWGIKLTRLAGNGQICLTKTAAGITGTVCGSITVALEAVLPNGYRVYQNGHMVSDSLESLTLQSGDFQITADRPLPQAITMLRYTDTPGGPLLQFSPDPFADFYEIAIPGQANLQTQDCSLLLPNTTGSFMLRIRGVNQSGQGPWSDPLSVTVRAAVPQQPVGLRVLAQADGFKILWGQMPGVSNYRLYRQVGDQQPVCVYEGSDNHYFIQDPLQNVTYRVSCINGYGEGPLSLPRDTRPEGLAYYDPEPEIRFQRNTLVNHHGYGGFDYVYNENRRILTYPE